MATAACGSEVVDDDRGTESRHLQSVMPWTVVRLEPIAGAP
jgi:hypothetical protein